MSLGGWTFNFLKLDGDIMTLKKRQFLSAALLAVTAATVTGQAMAQAYPARDVTAVIQWGAGGGTDAQRQGDDADEVGKVDLFYVPRLRPGGCAVDEVTADRVVFCPLHGHPVRRDLVVEVANLACSH